MNANIVHSRSEEDLRETTAKDKERGRDKDKICVLMFAKRERNVKIYNDFIVMIST